MRVFISYRRADATHSSRRLADALEQHVDRVFLDIPGVPAGAEWREQLLTEVRGADVVLAVIGPGWATSHERVRRGSADHASEDVLRVEIETAFKHGKQVLPVLVDGAAMPPREALARPFRPLADLQAEVLHRETWDRDVEALAADLEQMARGAPAPQPAARPRDPPQTGDRTRVQRIAAYMAEGSVVTVLGPGAHGADRSVEWDDGAPFFPDDRDLARLLARRFGLRSDDDLPRVSEHVAVMDGRRDLCRTLRRVLARPDAVPDSVHRFVAGVPGRLREHGRERHQLVVTTNYDTSLERAFDLVHEPYDLVLFLAGGNHRGRFVHVPWWDPDDGGPRPIERPNEYVGLPIEEDGDLTRSVILKLHGGLTDLGAGWEVRDNFVVTEDDLIGFLADGPIGAAVPVQILEKVRDSHFLFLGYSLRGWGPRVFPRRVLGPRLDARSWAVGSRLDDVERELWEDFGVDVVDEQLASYVQALDSELGREPHPAP